ncbi:hypothetical protein [Bacillus cereus]|uniref:hypothetical protein n=1 Tax=Bacillus cereus TaxID=1396 RepID=UPI000BFCC894|nr:hypothetical protein [Bacillus cereus]MEB9877464.1 hypothetical protein [Bacillus cereus]PGN73957.1 hypothetical protein CN963_29670 [Bacillus cereus]
MPNFPIKGTQYTELGDHRHMQTDITISNNGRLDATTETVTGKKWEGFHGSVKVFINDADKNILWATEQDHTFGVDGVSVGDPSRTDHWHEDIPQEFLDKIDHYAIVHDTKKIVVSPDTVGQWAKAIAPLIKAFSESQ